MRLRVERTAPVPGRTARGDLDRNRAVQYSAVHIGVLCALQITAAIRRHVSAAHRLAIVFVHMPAEPPTCPCIACSVCRVRAAA